jgi:hypothetical protein
MKRQRNSEEQNASVKRKPELIENSTENAYSTGVTSTNEGTGT